VQQLACKCHQSHHITQNKIGATHFLNVQEHWNHTARSFFLLQIAWQEQMLWHDLFRSTKRPARHICLGTSLKWDDWNSNFFYKICIKCLFFGMWSDLVSCLSQFSEDIKMFKTQTGHSQCDLELSQQTLDSHSIAVMNTSLEILVNPTMSWPTCLTQLNCLCNCCQCCVPFASSL